MTLQETTRPSLKSLLHSCGNTRQSRLPNRRMALTLKDARNPTFKQPSRSSAAGMSSETGESSTSPMRAWFRCQRSWVRASASGVSTAGLCGGGRMTIARSRPRPAERGRGVDGRPDLAVRAQPNMAGQHDLLRVAPDVLAVGMKYVTLARELLWRPTNEVPVLGEPGGGAQRAPLPAAADDDRRVRLLHRFWLTPRAGELVVLAGEVCRLSRQQARR